MNTVPVTILSAAVTLVATLFYFYTGLAVGQMRQKHDVKAPAVAGNPEFERAYRVQMNTLEQFAVFLPLLWIATSFPTSMAYLAPAFGLVWIVGRVLYMQGYMSAAEKRGTGFLISLVANGGLLVLGIIGLVRAWMAVHAA
jgi:glutathione S-transferase